jgi:hypothetical protein
VWSISKQLLKMSLILGHCTTALSQGVELVELTLNEFLDRYLSWNHSSNSSHDTSSKAMFRSGKSFFHHRRVLPLQLKNHHADLHDGGHNREA